MKRIRYALLCIPALIGIFSLLSLEPGVGTASALSTQSLTASMRVSTRLSQLDQSNYKTDLTIEAGQRFEYLIIYDCSTNNGLFCDDVRIEVNLPVEFIDADLGILPPGVSSWSFNPGGGLVTIHMESPIPVGTAGDIRLFIEAAPAVYDQEIDLQTLAYWKDDAGGTGSGTSNFVTVRFQPQPPPTHTPTATHTLTPTNTPPPTNTPLPTATATPSNTPGASPTPPATATSTPLPTATHTPPPTNTPLPTSTPGPSPTPTLTPTPVIQPAVSHSIYLSPSRQDAELPVKIYAYPRNSGNTDLEGFKVIHYLHDEFRLTRLTSGVYEVDSVIFPVDITVRYRSSVHSVWYSFTWKNVTSQQSIDVSDLDLPGGSYIQELEYVFGNVPAGFRYDRRSTLEGYFLNFSSPSYKRLSICSTLVATYAGNSLQSSDCDPMHVYRNELNLLADSQIVGAQPPYRIGDSLTFNLTLRNEDDNRQLTNPIMANLLPVGVDYVPGSWQLIDAPAGSPSPAMREIPNFRNSGRTLLRFTWEGAESYSLPPAQQFVIEFEGVATNLLPHDTLAPNDYYALSSSELVKCTGEATQQVDSVDIDQDNNAAETACSDRLEVKSAAQARISSRFLARGELDEDFVSPPTIAQSVPNGPIFYRYSLNNTGNVSLNQLVLFNILPHAGDTFNMSNSGRGSQWSPLLAAPISVPAGSSIHYTTTPNPCRPEIGVETNCNAASWTANYASIADPSQIKAYKVTFARTLEPGDELRFEVQMVVPTDVPTAGETAWNSFAYAAERADFGVRFSSEPNIIGVQAQPLTSGIIGDFVWLDSNENGLQDPGEPGLNNVRVLLYREGDAIPFKETITVNDIHGSAGYYLFSNLSAGKYRLRLVKPLSYAFTAADVGRDDKLDSDADPTTGFTGIISVNRVGVDPTWDFGLVPNPYGSLGDYVWVDSNFNGVQDDPVSNGVNGLTINLYADDGDQIQEPGGDDPFVGTTKTSFDIDGRPGYYSFTDLLPGPYFVEFVSSEPFTDPNAGGDETIDSDADPLVDGLAETGHSVVFQVDAGVFLTQIDAGLLAYPLLVDRGDAPASYGDAFHTLVPGLQLGQYIDTEDVSHYSEDALGDDLDNLPDEDGVTFIGESRVGNKESVEFVVQNHSSSPAKIRGWIDFNQNGVFDVNKERVIDESPINPNSGTIIIVADYKVPDDALCGETYARFRLSQNAEIGPADTEIGAYIGEVEDYKIRIICNTDLSITKDALSDEIGLEETITWQINAFNNGPDMAESVTITDTLPAGTIYEGMQITSGSGWSCSVNATTLVCAKKEMAAFEQFSLRLFLRVPARYEPETVENRVMITTLSNDLNPEDNWDEDTVLVTKEWIVPELPPSEPFAHLYFSDDLLSNQSERDFKASYAYNPLQVPLFVAFGLDASTQPTITVRGCLHTPSSVTCNPDSVITGHYLVESYVIDEIQYLENETTPVTIFTNTAPLTSTVVLNRIADTAGDTGKCTAPNSCVGFNRFDEPAFSWLQPDDFYFFVSPTSGGRTINCPPALAGSGRCLVTPDARPGIYILRGRVTVRLVFEDPILDSSGVFISDPIEYSAALHLEQFAPFVESDD